MDLLTPSSPGVFQCCLWPLQAPGYLWGGLPSLLSSAVWRQYPNCFLEHWQNGNLNLNKHNFHHFFRFTKHHIVVIVLWNIDTFCNVHLISIIPCMLRFRVITKPMKLTMVVWYVVIVRELWVLCFEDFRVDWMMRFTCCGTYSEAIGVNVSAI